MQTAIDKEVHQDHYHTSVQPVEDVVQLKEQHHHNIVPVEHRSFEHDSPEQVQLRLQQEQAKFRDEQERIEGQKTSSVAPIVAGVTSPNSMWPPTRSVTDCATPL